MVKFKPDLKEVRDIEDEFEQSDEDFDLSEFIPQGMLKSLIRLNERFNDIYSMSQCLMFY